MYAIDYAVSYVNNQEIDTINIKKCLIFDHRTMNN